MQGCVRKCCALFHQQFYIIKKFKELLYVSTFLNDKILNKLIAELKIIKYKNFIISEAYVNLQSNKNCA